MKITYYYIAWTGCVSESTIDTTDKDYVSHTDNDVTIKETYTDRDYETQQHIVTHSRFFEKVRQERIVAYKEEIERYKEDLSVFEKAENYKHYWALLEEHSKKRLEKA